MKGLVGTGFKIDRVDGGTKVNGPNMGANVGGFLRTVLAIGALEPRQLTTLVLEMFLQVILPVEHAAVIRTGKLDVANALQSEGHEGISFVH